MSVYTLDQVFLLRAQMRTDDVEHTFGMAYHVFAGYDSDTSGQLLCQDWIANFQAALTDILSSSTTFEGTHATHALPLTALPGSQPDASTPGTRGADAMPPNKCLVLSLPGILSELPRPGRVYIGGISKDDMANGSWKAAFLNGPVATFLTLLEQGFDSLPRVYRPVIISRQAGGAPITPFAADVGNGHSNAVIYSQRRRTSRQWGVGS
jgi:hypothetical protein